MTEEHKECCETCRFVKFYGDHLRCRRFPPGPEGSFPETSDGLWCGEYQPLPLPVVAETVECTPKVDSESTHPKSWETVCKHVREVLVDNEGVACTPIFVTARASIAASLNSSLNSVRSALDHLVRTDPEIWCLNNRYIYVPRE